MELLCIVRRMSLNLLCLEKGLYPTTRRFVTCQKLKGDTLRPTLDRITFMVPPSIREYEEIIFYLKQTIDLIS